MGKDYTTGTEVDAQGVLTPDSTGVDFDGQMMNGDEYIYWTEGLSGNWTAEFNGIIDSQSNGPLVACFVASGIIADYFVIANHATDHSVSVYFYEHATARGIYLLERYDNASYQTTKYVHAIGTQYYLTLEYVESTKLLTLYIYDNPAKITPLTTKSLTLHQSFNSTYLYGINGFDTADNTRLMEGRYSGLDFGEIIGRRRRMLIGRN